MGASLVVIGEPGYPPALAQVDAPPPLLYVKGRLELAEIPIVAIVGARNGSAVGQKFTRSLATDLGDEGFVIASGLARGIDTAAHLARLSEAQSPCLLAASTISIRRKTKSCIGRSASKAFSSASERHASRRAARTSRAGTASLRDLARRGGGRGRRALRVSDHGAVCRRARSGGLRRAQQPTRSPLGRHQQSPKAGGVPYDIRTRHCRDLGADPGQARPASRRPARSVRSRADARSSPRHSCWRTRADRWRARAKPYRYRRADQKEPAAGPQSAYRPA